MLSAAPDLPPTAWALLALGAVFLAVAADESVRRLIGAMLLLVIGVTLWQRARAARRSGAAGTAGAAVAGPIAHSGYGALGGFTTMVANAGAR